MSDLMTHVAAILIGVVITLYLVNSKKKEDSGESNSTSTKNRSVPNTTGNTKKRNRKKKNKKSAAVRPSTSYAEAAATPPRVAFKGAPPISNDDEYVDDDEPEDEIEEKAAAVDVAVAAKSSAKNNKKEETTSSSRAAPSPPPPNGDSNNTINNTAGDTSGGGGGGGKKKKNKKKNKGGGGGSGNNTKTAAANNNAKENRDPAPSKTVPDPIPTPTPPTYVQPLQPRVVVEEEWETIPVQKKKKRTKRISPVRTAVAESSAETAEIEKETVTIDASRVGIIIGPKGETMKKIEEKAGVKLDVNAPKPEESVMGNNIGTNQFRPVVGGRNTNKKQTATVVITEGTTESRVIAKKAILELADRGYAALLQADSFGEASVSIHPRSISEIVGTKGKIINAIQSELDVKLTIPKTDWTPKTVQIGNKIPSCRIGIAGDDPRNVKMAKQVIRDLCDYHHHEITHPGIEHEEVYVPQEYFHCVIGSRGSEIKHIRGNYHVDVYMPNSDSVTESVICVGRPNDVEKAISYIKLLMDRDSELREQKYSDDHFGDDSYGW